MNIGLKLRNLRKIKQLTQEELAERTDLSKGYISQIESGQSSPSMETFLQLLEVLGTSPETFLKKKKLRRCCIQRMNKRSMTNMMKVIF